MVRPEGDGPLEARRAESGLWPGRVGLAGASPAAVSAGAPRSRLQPLWETAPAERSVRSLHEERAVTIEPRGRKRSCGPSMKRTLQPREMSPRKGGAAEPIMSRRRQQTASARTGGTQDAPGVWRRARSDSLTRNRRDPPRQPTSGEDALHKPTAKGARGGRESEGLVVPSMRVERRAEGRGPALVVLPLGGKGEGMR
jgi:hypothetical protein